jgi:hypothetical protein
MPSKKYLPPRAFELSRATELTDGTLEPPLEDLDEPWPFTFTASQACPPDIVDLTKCF